MNDKCFICDTPVCDEEGIRCVNDDNECVICQRFYCHRCIKAGHAQLIELPDDFGGGFVTTCHHPECGIGLDELAEAELLAWNERDADLPF